MSKSCRSLALVAAIFLLAVPAVRADRMGTNPRPQLSPLTPATTVGIAASAILAYFGL